MQQSIQGGLKKLAIWILASWFRKWLYSSSFFTKWYLYKVNTLDLKKTYVLYTVYVILNCALSDVQLCSSSKYYVILNYALSDVQLCSKCQMMPLNTFFLSEGKTRIYYILYIYIHFYIHTIFTSCHGYILAWEPSFGWKQNFL